MRAGVHDRYGPPDVLRIEDVQRIPAGMSKGARDTRAARSS